jgi:uncharacterized membrane protein YhhN
MRETLFLAPWIAAAALALAYWLGFAAKEEPGRLGGGLKTASTGFLALALWIGGPWPIALGLTLGPLGDWCLAQRGERAFLAGMAAFAAGHLAYVQGFLSRAAEIGFPDAGPLRLILAVLLLALVASTEIWLAPRTGALRWPVRLYGLVIGAMGLSLIALPQNAGDGQLWLGGALFILSDLLLALRLFVLRSDKWQGVLSLTLWPAYWGGQALIAYGAILFWAIPRG